MRQLIYGQGEKGYRKGSKDSDAKEEKISDSTTNLPNFLQDIRNVANQVENLRFSHPIVYEPLNCSLF